MPPQFVEPLCQGLPQLSYRYGRQGRRIWWIGWFAGQTRHTHVSIIHVIERRQRLVVHWPVMRDAVQGPSLKIRRMKSRPVSEEVDRRTAYGIEVDRGYRRVVSIYRIVFWELPHIGVTAELGISTQLVVRLSAGKILIPHPRSLFQTKNMHAGFVERPSQSSTGSARANDQDVNRFTTHDRLPISCSQQAR